MMEMRVSEGSMDIYQSSCCDVFYIEDKNLVLVHWKAYCESEQYRTPLELALEVIMNGGDRK